MPFVEEVRNSSKIVPYLSFFLDSLFRAYLNSEISQNLFNAQAAAPRKWRSGLQHSHV